MNDMLRGKITHYSFKDRLGRIKSNGKDYLWDQDEFMAGFPKVGSDVVFIAKGGLATKIKFDRETKKYNRKTNVRRGKRKNRVKNYNQNTQRQEDKRVAKIMAEGAAPPKPSKKNTLHLESLARHLRKQYSKHPSVVRRKKEAELNKEKRQKAIIAAVKKQKCPDCHVALVNLVCFACKKDFSKMQ